MVLKFSQIRILDVTEGVYIKKTVRLLIFSLYWNGRISIWWEYPLQFYMGLAPLLPRSRSRFEMNSKTTAIMIIYTPVPRILYVYKPHTSHYNIIIYVPEFLLHDPFPDNVNLLRAHNNNNITLAYATSSVVKKNDLSPAKMDLSHSHVRTRQYARACIKRSNV